MYELTDMDMYLRLLMSFGLGALIGFERMFTATNRPAGLRTHILVAISACLAMLINYQIFDTFADYSNMDPGRMGSYVISGIGFLGAGTIIKEGANVKGLTTAASVWSCAMIGLACGAGLYLLSIMATLCIVFTLLIINMFEDKIQTNKE